MGHTESNPTPTTTQETLYAKSDHGGHAVRAVPQGFCIEWPEGSLTYPTKRQLIRALYAEGRDPGVSFDRYFKLGKWASPTRSPVATTLDLFGQPEDTPRSQDIPVLRRPKIKCTPRPTSTRVTAANTLMLFGSAQRKLTVEPTRVKPTRKQQALTVEHPLGVDLANRGHEVRKLLFKGFGSKMARGGYDPDDVLQEVYRGILARNKGTCPWDIRISSFGHYVHMVCRCVLANYHRKQSRKAEFEQIGCPNSLADGPKSMDAALKATEDSSLYGNLSGPEDNLRASRAISSLQDFIGDDSKTPLKGPACKAIPLVYQGYTRKEIAQILGMSPAKVTSVLSLLRSQAERWRDSQ